MSEEKMEEKKKFIDGLNTYFKLKAAYETNIKKDKTQISKLPGLSWREKRNEYAKIKHKCINCKRPVGSIFSTKIANGERQYIALCGDRNASCPLDIKINLGATFNITDDIRQDEEKIKGYNNEIIRDKNDLLFGYINAQQAVAKFDIIKEEVADATKIYEFTLDNYLNVVDNAEKKEELKKLKLEFYNNLDNFNAMMQQYKSTQNTQFVVDAVELYVTTMQPRVNDILKKTYSYNGVEYNEDDNTFHLIQIPISIEDLEWDIGEHGQKVVLMKMGLEKFSQNRTVRNTKAMTSAIPDIREKDKQEEPKFVMKQQIPETKSDSDEEDSDEEEDSEEEEEEDSDEDKPLPKITIHPKFLPDGTIAATEASRLGFKVELVKGDLIALNPNTNQKYKVTAGK
uniref:Uncharacterized protein n=1 Tax=viral metagenome TaxID=1070528 RepID=A0A6C0K1Y7_9ZZZZ